MSETTMTILTCAAVSVIVDVISLFLYHTFLTTKYNVEDEESANYKPHFED